MDDDFEDSADISSFDDVSSDFTDTSSFSEPIDVGSMMDDIPTEPIESFDVEPMDTNFEAELPAEEAAEIGSLMDESAIESIDEAPIETTEASAFDQLSEYYNSHNYGKPDYAEYSKDPEWQKLNNAYLQELGKEPVDYSNGEALNINDIRDDLIAAGIPEGSPEFNAILANEQAGIDRINEDQEENYAKLDQFSQNYDKEFAELNASEEELAENASLSHSDTENDVKEIKAADVPKIDDVSSWINDINPNYAPFDAQSPYSNNCGSCAFAVEQRLDGNTDISAANENIGTIEEMNKITDMEQVAMSPDEIKEYLVSQGPGSHGIVGIDRDEGPGHWFNAYYDGEKVVAIDGQTGEINDWPPDYGNVTNWDISVRKEEA